MPVLDGITKYVRENRTSILHVLLILCVVSASYFNALSNGYVTDDFGLAVNNPNAKSWDRLGRIFTTGYWDAEGWTGGLYRPLTILSFLIEYTFAGLSPVVHHLDNVVLHLLCSVMAYLLLKDMSENPRAALYASLLFAAHPVHTEAVTWVSGRAEILSAVFSLSSMLAFIRYRGRTSRTASCILFALALLSKESAVVVPVLLAVYILLFETPGSGERRTLQLSRKLWPYFAVTAVFIVARFYVLGKLGPALREQALYGLGPYDRFLTMCRALYEYIRLGFLPTGLGVDYIFPPPTSIFDLRVLFSLLVLLATAVFAARIIRFSRTVFFAASWFLVALLPVSNIIPAGIIMSDRAMYLPSLGICMIIGTALSSTSNFFIKRDRRVLSCGSILMLPVLGAFMTGTIARNPVWQNQRSLAESHIGQLLRNIEHYPEYTRSYRELARIRIRFTGYGPETEKAIREAYSRIGPDDAEIRQMLAYSYLNRSMLKEALSEIMTVLEEFTACASDYYFAGNLLARMKNYEEAMPMVDFAIELNPNKTEYLMLKGEILMETGDDESAMGVYERVTVLDPENYDAYLIQGIILDSARKFGPAIEKVKKAVELRPDIPDLHYFLAVAYVDAGMPGPAAEELDNAITLRPDYREAIELRERLGFPR